MTKYILHGGRCRLDCEWNRKFFFEMIADHDEPVNVLCVYFAKDRSKWSELFEDDQNNFGRASQGRKINFVLADDDPETLRKQIGEADSIWLRGGETANLLKPFAVFSNEELKKMFEGKTIGGSSAGAYLISKYYFSNDYETLNEGRGLLDVKAFAHYDKSKEQFLENLKNYKEDLPLCVMADAEFKVIKV